MNRKVLITLLLLLGSTSWSTAQIFTPDLSISSDVTYRKVTSRNLSECRLDVWSAWREANERLDEEPLAALVPLSEVEPQKWSLIEEDLMPYLWGSKGEQPASGYPLFIAIHGSGPKEHEWKATHHWTQRYEDAPSVYFIPQIPTEKRYRWWYRPEQKAWEKLFRLAFLSDQINPNKIYFTGISEGGYGSQRLGAFYADYLAGVGPMAGGEPLDNAPVLNYRKIAFAFETGEEDMGFGRQYYTDLARVVFDQMSVAYPGDFNHRIRLQKDKGHSIDYTLVTPWLAEFERNPYPTAYSWVNYPMDDRYRIGFYNLAVIEPFNIAPDQDVDRVIFDFKIEQDNQIHLTAHTFNVQSRAIGDITTGKLRVYLSPELLDLSKRVHLYLNGKLYYSGKVKMSMNNLISSCHTFADPMRLYPAAIDIQF